MEDQRPDPDSLLERVRLDEARRTRGSLKIFFGYIAGVGKTFAMLEAAQNLAAAGVDVVAGYVEPHGRPETESLLEGLEVLPFLEVEYRGIKVREFDLQAALKRRPQLLLVDELAHTNSSGLTHTKRWQDVVELLEAGINVYTTLNVQHVESLNDVIAQITAVQVRETVPDSVFDDADSVEVVDLPPGELIERLHQGKVYVPAQAERAVESFFTPANLGALREIALRRTADRVHGHLETTRLAAAGPRETWATVDTLIVCVGPSPTSAKVIRTSKRMAASLNVRWIALGVERSSGSGPEGSASQQLMRNIQLAERLGAETATISGDDIAHEIITYARSQNVTKIVIGKSAEPRWRRFFRTTIVDDLIERSGDIDVYVVQGREEPGTTVQKGSPPRRQISWQGYGWAVAAVAVAAFIAWGFQDLGLSEANRALVFLFGVVIIAARFGFGPGALATVAGVLAFDFFFVPPHLTFAVADAQYAITFGIMLVVALVISSLAERLRRQVRIARYRERRLGALYRLSRELSAVSGTHQITTTAEREVSGIFGTQVAIFLPRQEGRLEAVVPMGDNRIGARELAVATWSYEHGQIAGAGTETLPEAAALYVPIITPQGTTGVLSIAPAGGEQLLSPENRQLLETLAAQIGTAVERDELAVETRRAALEIDRERLRSSLLSAVSHDLRTPLAVIAGASSALLDMGPEADESRRKTLLTEVTEESQRLSRLVDNLLTMTKFDAGPMLVQKQWFPLEDVLGSALGRLRKEMTGRIVNKQLAPDLPLVPLDGVLIEQVLVNLMENALKYSGPDSPLDIFARQDDGSILVGVADRGPGLASGEEKNIFEKLYRGSASRTSDQRGAGLGLAIAQAIVNAHGGRVWAENRAGGGAVFWFTLPFEGSPPDLDTIEREGLQS